MNVPARLRSPKGTPRQGLAGATLGFFIGFAAVALFGPTVHRLGAAMSLSPIAVGFLVAAPLLSGSLLRIPFAAWVDSAGGRRPFLILLLLAIVGMGGLFLVLQSVSPAHLNRTYYPVLLMLGFLCGSGIATFSVGIAQVSYWYAQNDQGRALGIYAGAGNMAPGIFSVVLPLAVGQWGLSQAYLAWLCILIVGTAAYFAIARDAWYFQLISHGRTSELARRISWQRGQRIFPTASTMRGLALSSQRGVTWALVALYFISFGGFLALTAWLPTYWQSYFGTTASVAGILTAVFSLSTSIIRIGGGCCSDRFGGQRTSAVAMFCTLAGAIAMACSSNFRLSVLAELLMAVGMGVNNAAVFKMVPEYIPDLVGGASGWIGGLGALGGFVLPPLFGLFVEVQGTAGYARGFLTVVALAAIGLGITSRLKTGTTSEAARARRIKTA